MHFRIQSQLKEAPVKLFDLLMLVLSLYSIVSVVVQLTMALEQRVAEILYYMDFVVCFVFFIDFLRQFFSAQSKLQYMRWGWIDLLASIPVIEEFRFLRIFQIFRVIKVMRHLNVHTVLLKLVDRDRSELAFSSALVITFLLMALGPIGILHFEGQVPNSNIQSAEDAIWWAFVTLTTVGYGDYYPITTGGRIVAAILCVAGIGLFGTFSGMAANWLLGRKEHPSNQK
ncbi:ion transporter [Paraneptunicella aestuarii]|uniref:ion transporter n=1 Tax=Paraneptunicella aestuarii TaxID=2831148 RepID=UPI001E5AADC0|nr:ion transporter [Paraneptunicella aestuarii]UAA38595.1 ion transporter [Paraneptunicella aestuarii]